MNIRKNYLPLNFNGLFFTGPKIILSRCSLSMCYVTRPQICCCCCWMWYGILKSTFRSNVGTNPSVFKIVPNISNLVRCHQHTRSRLQESIIEFLIIFFCQFYGKTRVTFFFTPFARCEFYPTILHAVSMSH